MDAPAIREELRDMARRLATAGYYVMLPNLYYRAGRDGAGPLARPGRSGRKRMFELMDGAHHPMVMDDTDALLAFVDAGPGGQQGPDRHASATA